MGNPLDIEIKPHIILMAFLAIIITVGIFLKDYISIFVVKIIEEVFSILEIKKQKKRNSLPFDSLLKLFVIVKSNYILFID